MKSCKLVAFALSAFALQASALNWEDVPPDVNVDVVTVGIPQTNIVRQSQLSAKSTQDRQYAAQLAAQIDAKKQDKLVAGDNVKITNGVISVSVPSAAGVGAARPLPKYLHALDFADSYPDEAAEYYRSRGNGKTDGGCSAVRDGGFLYRNFDYPFDERAEFVVRMSSGKDRFASVGVAQVGTNLTEQIVTSGKWSKWYKALPGATVDGINENGVCVEVNVVDGPVTNGWHTDGDLHPLAAVRWVLDNATNAQSAAEYLAANIRFPTGWTQNFHYMVADTDKAYVVENGTAYDCNSIFTVSEFPTMTNFSVHDFGEGAGKERFTLLVQYGGASITNAWYTRAYRPDTTPPWVSEFGGDWNALALATNYWARSTKEAHRGESFNGTNWWQTVHTSVYDLSNRVLRVAVQETDDWYVFQVPASGSGGAEVDAYTKAETDAKLGEKANLNGDSSENFAASLIEAGVLALGGSTITEESGGGLNLAGNVIVNDTVTDSYGNRLADKADREELERISPYILIVTNSIDVGPWGRITFLPDGTMKFDRVSE